MPNSSMSPAAYGRRAPVGPFVRGSRPTGYEFITGPAPCYAWASEILSFDVDAILRLP
jgi:hypothetical protein